MHFFRDYGVSSVLKSSFTPCKLRFSGRHFLVLTKKLLFLETPLYAITLTSLLFSTFLGCAQLQQAAPSLASPSHANLQLESPVSSQILLNGRTLKNAENSVSFGYPGVTFSLNASTTEVNIIGSSTNGQNHFDLFIDNQYVKSFALPKTESTINLFKSEKQKNIQLKLIHNNETWQGIATINNFSFAGKLLPPPPTSPNKLMVIGDSISCGEAAARPLKLSKSCSKDHSWWNANQSYGMLLGKKLNAQTQLICHGGRGLVRSWNGATNELNGPDFYTRIIPNQGFTQEWQQADFKANVIVVALGTNDFNLNLGPFPEQEPFVETYIKFVQKILQDHPYAQVFITDGAMVNNKIKPQKTVLQLYLKAVKNGLKDDRVHLAFASHQPGDECDAHPNANQHQKMADELYRIIMPHMD